LLLGSFILWCLGLFSGEVSTPGDTLLLQPVEVRASSLERFSRGQQVISIDSTILRDLGALSLSDLLQRRSGLFVRQYGPGMIASLTMRGTSAGHNAFFWNGLPINSPSLGQMDLSLLPLSGVDRVQIHMGGSGANYGTDAIGGAIHLSSDVMGGTGWMAEASTGVGSFGLNRQEIQIGFSNSQVGSRSRFYRLQAPNRYPFHNMGKIGLPVEIQEHAGVNQKGLMQDLVWRVGVNSQLSSSFWWNTAHRDVQPVMGSNSTDVQSDQSTRWVLDFNRTTENRHLNLKAGWVRDEMVFNRSDVNITNQFLLAGELDWSLGSRLEFKSGSRATYILGKLSTYEATDNRIEIYQAVNFNPSPDWVVSVNLRQLVFEGEFAPFSPSVGIDWSLLQQKGHQLTGKVAGARSFKVPTLNDRYWVPGGNPDLKSENALSGELGFLYRYTDSKNAWETRVSYYDMQVDNWILWLPGDVYWSPRNVRKVSSHGVDLFFSGHRQSGKWKTGLSGSLSLNQAVILRSDGNNIHEIGKILPYTPGTKAQLGLDVHRESLQFFINGHRIGDRFVSIDNQSGLAAYQLFDAGWRYERAFNRQIVSLGFQVNNFLNTRYEVLRLRPMPGRNFELNITYIL
jgi:vitamin B12 transporter